MTRPWWLSFADGLDWSPEERQVRRRIFLFALGIFLTLFAVAHGLASSYGMDKRTEALLIPILCLPPGFIIGRLLCARLWPDLVSKANLFAATRIAGTLVRSRP